MTKAKGFGSTKKPKPDQSKRKAAAQKYEEMKQSGMPVFNIFVRLQHDSRWLPAGSLAVERSNQIELAIFQQEEELKKGVLRLYPKLTPQRDQFEYGYQLRQFADEEIRLAVRPQPTLGQKFGQLVKQLKTRFGI
ncbi:MAG: HHL1-like protein [Pseudanabaenaceae cyanobacterium bins.68]|nr:HHL1-like protein [Pseudanabaenaceae cyanobacterium bins.68]